MKYRVYIIFCLLCTFSAFISLAPFDHLWGLENKNKFNAHEYPMADVAGGLHFVKLLCSPSNSGANYCKWQLLKGVLMSPFYMDTSNIMGW